MSSQWAFLATLDAAMQSRVDAADVLTTAARLLSEYLDVDRCAYAEIVDDNIYDITGDHARGVASIVGRWPVRSFGDKHLAMMLAGETYAVADVDRDSRIDPEHLAAYRAAEIGAVICVPLLKQGAFTAAIAVHAKSPREWLPEEVSLVGMVGNRCWEALERARAERALAVSEARLAYSARVANVGFWTCDLPFDVLQWDTQVKVHFWMPLDARVTIDLFYERIHPEDREPTRTAIDAAIGSRHTYDVVYRTVDPLSGAVKYIRALGGADYAPDCTPIRFDGITVDVTKQKHDEQKLRDQDRRKDEFIATLAHELRNPLAPIRSGLELLAFDRASPRADHAVAVMGRQLDHLVRMVDDLLDISRVTLGKITLVRSRISLRSVIETAIETTRGLVDAAGLALNLELPETSLELDGDATRLSQVFANLVNNATKFTPRGGAIQILANVEPERVIVRVRDTGVGIPVAMLDAVFDMFTQVGQTLDRSHDGLGIGLTFARQIVELHGGTAIAEPVETGATIVVTLPIAGPVENAAAPVVAARPAGALDVLVVDDNRDAAELLGMLLEQRGYQVRLAEDGPSALRETDRHAPDVIVLDIGLPGMSGYDVAKTMRAGGLRATLIALTGWGAQHDRDEARAAGFDHHLVKPVDFAKLAKILAELAG
ncbi:MAG TPA: response regulator [Kofleriaceae bacterium]